MSSCVGLCGGNGLNIGKPYVKMKKKKKKKNKDTIKGFACFFKLNS